ncbi:type II toxin-antitoxin system CcdA family antitoxin [Thiomicrospira sp. R3]|uniref:type II toxin-antitoxin system CcdA family antitoxin n=1 Tax=Thiomicrospira sp. R3 TaxID=3035472 RepID=UPI00259BDDB1|nr:type II toxin-antitoxin system CcdA family antitoxin [Thiomicrospira sp. R3]WFE69527.1 type II toxin-antitoxin system CcdA family antitoxin [Thiomicrospira sp. R3]
MNPVINPMSSKKPTNVSVNADLLAKAKRLKINLSATLEQALIKKVQERERQQWRLENADSIQAYNDFVEQQGSFSDSVRKF